MYKNWSYLIIVCLWCKFFFTLESYVSTKASFAYQNNLDFQEENYWHFFFPTIHLMHKKQFCCRSSFLPHCFSLWELAPKKGKNVRVALLDTGFVGEIEKKHLFLFPDITTLPACYYTHNLNCLYTYNSLYLCAQKIANYTVDKQTIESIECSLIKIIKEYVSSFNIALLERFIVQQCNEKIVNNNMCLTSLGQELVCNIQKIIHGSFFRKIFFTHFTPYRVGDRDILIECLPIARKKTPSAMHGTRMYSIIKGMQFDPQCTQPCCIGIAPEATVIMIKAFDDNGMSNPSIINYALQKSLNLDIDIINLSLAFFENPEECMQREIDSLLQQFSFVVVAAGNNFNAAKSSMMYPSNSRAITCSVGSFSYMPTQFQALVAPFCCHYVAEPLLMAPGVSIASPKLFNHQTDYVCLDGTSYSAALVSGCFALFLGEFKHVFTKNQILKVAYHSTVKMHTDDPWTTKCILGAIDMRLALFILHVIKTLIDIDKSFYKKMIEKKFDNLVVLISTLLIKQVDCDEYAFHCDYMNWIKKSSLTQNFYKKYTVQEAVNSIVTKVVSIINAYENKKDTMKQKNKGSIAEYISLLEQEKIDLFYFLMDKQKQCVIEALA